VTLPLKKWSASGERPGRRDASAYRQIQIPTSTFILPLRIGSNCVPFWVGGFPLFFPLLGDAAKVSEIFSYLGCPVGVNESILSGTDSLTSDPFVCGQDYVSRPMRGIEKFDAQSARTAPATVPYGIAEAG
jgi:hypothetical protein